MMVITDLRNTLEHREVIAEWLKRIPLIRNADYWIFNRMNEMLKDSCEYSCKH